jgi:hypothetical protein
MSGTRRHYAEWNKTHAGRLILHNLTYMRNIRCWTDREGTGGCQGLGDAAKRHVSQRTPGFSYSGWVSSDS